MLEITNIVDEAHLNDQEFSGLEVKFEPLGNVKSGDNISVGRVSLYRQGKRSVVVRRILATLALSFFGPLLLVSLAAWVLLYLFPAELSVSVLCSSRWLPSLASLRGEAEFYSAVANPSRLCVSWLLMLTAMTAPLLSQPFNHLWNKSLMRRRWRALVLFGLAYSVVWTIAAGALFLVAMILQQYTVYDRLVTETVEIAVVVLWQVSLPKRQSLGRCHYLHRLSAQGWRADRDCLAFGAANAVWCVSSCWALMLFAWSVPHYHFVAMLSVCMLIFVERHVPAALLTRSVYRLCWYVWLRPTVPASALAPA